MTVLAGTAVVVALMAAVAGVAGAFDLVAAFSLFLFVAVREWKLGRATRRGQITIAMDRLRFGGRQSLALEQVRRVELAPHGDHHEVRIHTPDGSVVAASVGNASQAEFITDQVEQAYRAYLRSHS